MEQPLDLTELTLKVRVAASPSADGNNAGKAPKSKNNTTMDRRSWYMPTSSADALSALIDDLHHETRRPKHEVLAAIITVALDRKDAIRQQLQNET